MNTLIPKKYLPVVIVGVVGPLLTTAALAYTTPDGVRVFKKRINIRVEENV